MDKQSDTSDNQYLKNVNINKLSHKISKPTKKQCLEENPSEEAPHPHNQPPVYNINKKDFRDFVQKLTGSPSPSHQTFSTPTPIHPPKTSTTRLQRIRPPPLPQLTHRSPPFPPPPTPPNAPFSPLPPLPPHAAAESPVSAYMRFLHNSNPALDSNKAFAGFSPLISPRWGNQNQPPPLGPLSPTAFQVSISPASFGCLNSPKSPCGLLSPGLLASPSSFPVSPTVPLQSPKRRGL